MCKITCGISTCRPKVWKLGNDHFTEEKFLSGYKLGPTGIIIITTAQDRLGGS